MVSGTAGSTKVVSSSGGGLGDEDDPVGLIRAKVGELSNMKEVLIESG